MMKQKLYIVGIITVLMIFAASLMKVSHIAGAGILMVTGITLFLLVFLPLALYNHFSSESITQGKALYIVTWISCVIVFGSMLFKVMHWPGAGRLILLALPFPFVVFLPVYLYITSKIRNHNIYHTVYVLFLLVYMAVISTLLSLNVSRSRIDQSLVLAGNSQKMSAWLSQDPKDMNLEKDPDLAQNLNASANRLIKTAASCRQSLFSHLNITENELLAQATRSTNRIDSRSLAAYVMLNGEKQSPASVLETDIRNFIAAIAAIPGCDSLASEAAGIFMENRQDLTGVTWGKAMFENKYLSWVLIYLRSLETDVIILKRQAMMSAKY